MPTIQHGSFTIERTYKAPQDLVFKAFEDADAKRRWFAQGDDENWQVESYENDFRVGGSSTATSGTVSVYIAVTDPVTRKVVPAANPITGMTNQPLTPAVAPATGSSYDIRLRAGVPNDTIPENPAVVDWDAAWQLVKSLMATGQVHYLFLARSRHVPLYKAALRAGATDASLAPLMQYPSHARNTMLRHSAGHTKHIHVRWKCALEETQCVDP